LIVIFYK